MSYKDLHKALFPLYHYNLLVARGMHGVQLIVSDSHSGLRAAREATLPGVPWQRCQMHLQQDAHAHVTKASLRSEVADDIRSVFNARSLEDAKRILAGIVGKYAKTQSRLSACFPFHYGDGGAIVPTRSLTVREPDYLVFRKYAFVNNITIADATHRLAKSLLKNHPDLKPESWVD